MTEAVAEKPVLQLTSAWTALKPHSEQAALWKSKARFIVVPAARRSGKTEVSKRKLVMSLWDCLVSPRPWEQPRFFAAAPTREQAKRIWWNDLIRLIPASWRADVLQSELKIVTKWGAELIVVGLDKPARIEGVSWDGGVIDEYSDCPVGCWQNHIRPALSDRNGWAWLIGVPDRMAPGQIQYEEMVHRAKSGTDPEWACYHWPSADILPPEEIESARRSMDPRTFEQEFLGRFIIAGGKAFPDFETHYPGAHVKDVPYDPALPLCWSLDFNIDPMCSLVIQHHKGEVRVIDELILPDTRTEIACETFLDRAEKNKWNLTGLAIYGDASGSARDSTSGTSDWAIIRNTLKNYSPKMKVPKANPSIKDTINAVNAKIKAADGSSNLLIDKRCTQIINDLRSAIWPSDLEPQHALAGLRYFTEYEYPILIERKGGGRIGFTKS